MIEVARVASTPERLKEAMRLSGKKQVDLVKSTGIDKGSISNYLSGRYEPKQEAIYKLALALNVSEMWLWGYDVPMVRHKEQKNPERLSPRIKEINKILSKLDEDKLNAVLLLLQSFLSKQ